MSPGKARHVIGFVLIWLIVLQTGRVAAAAEDSGSAPAVPANVYLYVSPPVASRIDVFWDHPKDLTGVVGYHVYRDGKMIATKANDDPGHPANNVYPDTGLSPETKYTYTVTSVDGDGNESAHTAPVGATTAPAPAPNLDVLIKPSRTSGVAPLSVFFDVTETGSFTDGSFIDATCVWDFDADGTDPEGKYRRASGFVAAHVFDKPGTYRVRCDVYDVQGRHDSEEVIVEVQAFSGKTYYVAANGSDENPGTMGKPVLTVKHALLDLAEPNTRILFRKGDTFKTRFVNASKRGGPVIVTGYSDPESPSDEAPVIYSTAVDGDWATLYVGSDWRMMDLRVRSGGLTAGKKGPRYPGGAGFGPATDSLLYRLEEDHLLGGLGAGGTFNTMVECNIHHLSGNAAGYTSTRPEDYGSVGGCAIIGNWVHDFGDDDVEHVFRLQGGSRYFIAFNKFEANVVNYDALTIRGTTDRVVVYRNVLDRATNFTPQGTPMWEYIHHCVAEANSFVGRMDPSYYTRPSPVRQVALGIAATDIVVRNNVFYNYECCIGVAGSERAVGPSRDIRLHNNTAIGIEPGFVFAYCGEGCANISLKSNLMLSRATEPPNEQDVFLQIRGGGPGAGLESDQNLFFGKAWPAGSYGGSRTTLTEWQSATGLDVHSLARDPGIMNVELPGFVGVGVPGVGLDQADLARLFAGFAALGEKSPAIDAGARGAGVVVDFHGKLRDDKPDIGAVEYVGAGMLPAP